MNICLIKQIRVRLLNGLRKEVKPIFKLQSICKLKWDLTLTFNKWIKNWDD